jgi:two-component system response regulator PilR (NtrC family)
MGKANILLLHHDRLLQKSLYELLCRKGFRVDLADCVETAMRHLDENPRRVILTEINETANRLAKLLKRHKYPSQIVLLTSYAHPESASETLELGAFEYLVRPVEDEKIIATVEKALASVSSLIKECAFAKAQAKKESTFYGLVGKSAQMQQIYSLVQRIADTKATVLLRGESGTGKRMIAHAIHQASAKRKNKPFVEVSCGALPREIIESELFGHTKGSFTGAVNDRKGRFELAHGGTILLDDIDSFSLEMQVKLLRVLQQKEFERVGDHKTMNVDVRVVASTNQNLEKAVAEKAFREDLYYRLNVISLCVPPLRERKEDLPLLIDHFVNHYAK